MTLKTSLTYFTLILFFTLLPLVSGEYYVNLGSQIMIAAVFAASLNLLVGYGGLTSLGHASFLGLAAYVSAWLYLNMGMGHAYSAPIALGLTTLVGALFWLDLFTRLWFKFFDANLSSITNCLGCWLPMGKPDKWR